MRLATIKRRSTVPYYAAAGTWVLYAALFPLYKAGYFLLVAIVSAVVFLVMNAICGTQTVEVPDQPKEEKSTGNAELDKMIKDGSLAIAEMKRLDDAIEDESISADIVRLEEVSRKIFDRVKEDPAKLPQIRKFMDYYLPTTLKLLNAYDRAAAAGISGENVDATRTKVEGMMRTIVAAFEKQLDSLFGTETMDISADITVLETMLQREGLIDSGDALHAEDTGSAAQAMGDIKLEL
ncbi:MAG: 5-bromo-4-chloroindolyl phosphate hydrolysis family protein [Hominicoprocola sp.]